MTESAWQLHIHALTLLWMRHAGALPTMSPKKKRHKHLATSKRHLSVPATALDEEPQTTVKATLLTWCGLS